jgi:hypothetical protein
LRRRPARAYKQLQRPYGVARLTLGCQESRVIEGLFVMLKLAQVCQIHQSSLTIRQAKVDAN